MKEEIRGRKRRFWALMLAVILGMLPTVEVFAQAFVVNTNATSKYVTLNGMHILGDTMTIYVKAGDTIGVNNPNGTTRTFYQDETDTPLVVMTAVGGGAYADDWGTPAANTLTVPAWTAFTATDIPAAIAGVATDRQGWKVVIGVNGSGEVTSMSFFPIVVFTVKYLNNGADISNDPSNPNPRVFPSINGNLATDLHHALNPLASASFTGWYTDAGDQVNGLVVDTDLQLAGVTNTTTFTGGVASFVQDADGTYHLNAHFSSGGTGGGGTVEPEPEPVKHTITYYPNNDLSEPYSTETEEESITLPKFMFKCYAGQMLAGWQLADTTQDPVVGTGHVFKPGEYCSVDQDLNFIAVWKDNPTFKIECDENYSLMVPDNNKETLDKLILENLKVTYYADGIEPEPSPTPEPSPEPSPTPEPSPEPSPSPTPTASVQKPMDKAGSDNGSIDPIDPDSGKSLWAAGKNMTSEDIDITVPDPSLFNKPGVFDAKITYKGLYNRTLEKTVSVEIQDPNALGPETTIDLGKGRVLHYPSSAPYIKQKWSSALIKQGLIYVEDTSDGSKLEVTKVTMKKSKSAGDKQITQVKVKIGKNKIKTYEKKELDGAVFTVRPCYVWTGNYVDGSATVNDKGKVKSMDIKTVLGDDLTIKKPKKKPGQKKKKNPIVTTETGIGFQNKNYLGTMTFEELGIPNPNPTPVPTNTPTPIPTPIPTPSPTPVP